MKSAFTFFIKRPIWLLVVLLVVLQQDFWLRTNDTLLAGFLPIELAWQMGVSLAACVVWILVVIFEWPSDSLSDSPANEESGG